MHTRRCRPLARDQGSTSSMPRNHATGRRSSYPLLALHTSGAQVFGNFHLRSGVGPAEAHRRAGMNGRIRVAALAVALISGVAIAAGAETVNGVTVLRGKPPTVGGGGAR